jgi:prevent-host-death family protein
MANRREEIVTAAEANRRFSALLRRVRDGYSIVVTSHGKPVARLTAAGERGDRALQAARAALLSRLRSQPTIDVGRWTRDELYDD